MQIIFDSKEMKKNIEFTKKIYSMTDLDGYNTFFDRFLPDEWKRDADPKMNLEKFLKRMENSNFFVSKLFMLEDEHIPIRYSVNARASIKKDSLLEIHCNFTNKNVSKIHSAYFETYARGFLESL